MYSPSPVNSAGDVYFNVQPEPGNNEDREPRVSESAPAIMRSRSNSPIMRRESVSPRRTTSPHSSLDRSRDSARDRESARIERRNEGDSGQNSGEDGDMRNILVGITGVLKDLTNEIRSMKQGQTPTVSADPCIQSQQGPIRSMQSNSSQFSNPAPNLERHSYESRQNRHVYDRCGADPAIWHPTSLDDAYNNNSQTPPTAYEDVVQRRVHRQPYRLFANDIGNMKISPFTGKEDWSVWIARFEAVTRRFGLTNEDKLDQLLPRLEGQAAQFVFTQLPPDILASYPALMHELNIRFRVIETARAYAAKFSRRSQKIGETAEEFASDLKVLYDKAHGFRDRKTRDEDLVRRFLDGLRDDDVRFEVEYHKEPETIDEAVFHVVNFIQTRNIRDRDRRNRDNARLARNEADGDVNRNISATSLKTQTTSNGTLINNLGRVETDKDLIISQLLDKISSLEKEKQRENSKQNKDVLCYACQKTGHYARDCPNVRSPANPRRGRWSRGMRDNPGNHSQPSQTNATANLNWTGPNSRVGGRSQQ